MMSALSGIKIACWDIAGKFYNAPVANLLGGRIRDRVKMYANAWFVGAREPADFAKAAKKTVAMGVKALKWDPFGKAHMTLSLEEMDKAVKIVGAVRDAVGPYVDLLIECHGRFNPFTAVEVSRQLAPFHPMLIETLCRTISIPASGCAIMRWFLWPRENASTVNTISGMCCISRRSILPSRISFIPAVYLKAENCCHV